MAEKMPEGTDLRAMTRSGVPCYPWETWNDGAAYRLAAGEDFTVDTEKFRRAAHSYAERHGLRAVTRKDGPKHLLLQFHRPEPD